MKSKFPSLTNAYTIGGESLAYIARNAVDGAAASATASPLEEALAAVARLDLNPLCDGEKHARRLLREDMERIVRELAKRMEEGK